MKKNSINVNGRVRKSDLKRFTYKIDDDGARHFVTIDQIIVWCKVSRKTAERWCDGIQKPPASALLLIEIMHQKRFPWSGWEKFGVHDDGYLYNTDSRATFNQGFLIEPKYTESLVETYKYQVEQLKYQLKELEKPPEPLNSAEIIEFKEIWKARQDEDLKA